MGQIIKSTDATTGLCALIKILKCRESKRVNNPGLDLTGHKGLQTRPCYGREDLLGHKTHRHKTSNQICTIWRNGVALLHLQRVQRGMNRCGTVVLLNKRPEHSDSSQLLQSRGTRSPLSRSHL